MQCSLVVLVYRVYLLSLIFFFFQCYAAHRDLHSFPTRRSSDLPAGEPGGAPAAGQRRGPGNPGRRVCRTVGGTRDRKSTRLNSSHGYNSYAVFCLKKKKKFI